MRCFLDCRAEIDAHAVPLSALQSRKHLIRPGNTYCCAGQSEPEPTESRPVSRSVSPTPHHGSANHVGLHSVPVIDDGDGGNFFAIRYALYKDIHPPGAGL